MEDTLMQAMRELLVDRENMLDQLDELIAYPTYIEALGIKDGKARIIAVPNSQMKSSI